MSAEDVLLYRCTHSLTDARYTCLAIALKDYSCLRGFQLREVGIVVPMNKCKHPRP